MRHQSLLLLSVLSLSLSFPAAPARGSDRLKVVTTLSTYAAIAREIGGERVTVDWIVNGNQDPHFVRPRPSLARKLADADLFVSTGLDLELWAPSLVDLSGNSEIRSGQRRYVSAAQGVHLLEVPKVISRGEGGVHIYGNPHFINDPLAAQVVARNIATGLARIDPQHADYYRKNLARFDAEIDRRLYGPELLRLLGAKLLHRLSEKPAALWSFLESNKYKGQPLIDKLGGWLRQGRAFRGRKAIAYHKGWVYFSRRFGLRIADYVEPRPSIPPTPRHIEQLIERMRNEGIDIILAATFYDQAKVRRVAEAVGARPVIVCTGTACRPEIKSYCDLIDHLVGTLAAAFERGAGS